MFPTEIRNSTKCFVYNGGLIFGVWVPLIAVSLLSKAEELILYLLGANIIVGSITIVIGTKINPETRNVDLA